MTKATLTAELGTNIPDMNIFRVDCVLNIANYKDEELTYQNLAEAYATLELTLTPRLVTYIHDNNLQIRVTTQEFEAYKPAESDITSEIELDIYTKTNIYTYDDLKKQIKKVGW